MNSNTPTPFVVAFPKGCHAVRSELEKSMRYVTPPTPSKLIRYEPPARGVIASRGDGMVVTS